uniref:Uncharacterized protein n=1 Tax=Ditylenchus dipsaci TaxID=166011 RepID=A0A915CQC5_9BILA
MLRTEQIRSGRAASSNSAGANSGPLTGIQQTEAQQQQQGGSRPRNDDPSLMDYEAIDVYWRRDIEQEKGSFYAHPNNQGQQQHQQQQHMTMDSATEQYERDLQLLTEKSLFVPLNSEERYRYENLSKAHYSDFYRALGQPLQASAKQKGLSQVREGIATTSSGKSLGGESLILTDLSYNQPTSSSNPRSTANVVQRQTNIKNEVFSDYDEDKPEDFFRYLAKESVDNEPLPILGVTLLHLPSPLPN